jgi:hypothetical protein
MGTRLKQDSSSDLNRPDPGRFPNAAEPRRSELTPPAGVQHVLVPGRKSDIIGKEATLGDVTTGLFRLPPGDGRCRAFGDGASTFSVGAENDIPIAGDEDFA